MPLKMNRVPTSFASESCLTKSADMSDWRFLGVLMGQRKGAGDCVPVFCGLYEGKDLVVSCPASSLPYNRCSVNWHLKGETRAVKNGTLLLCVCSADVKSPESRLNGGAQTSISSAWILCSIPPSVGIFAWRHFQGEEKERFSFQIFRMKFPSQFWIRWGMVVDWGLWGWIRREWRYGGAGTGACGW